jgi:hypothetical protein
MTLYHDAGPLNLISQLLSPLAGEQDRFGLLGLELHQIVLTPFNGNLGCLLQFLTCFLDRVPRR